MIQRILGLTLVAALLAGCSQNQMQLRSFERVLRESPGNAQPSVIVAREIALMKRAAEIGQAEAALEFGSANAVVLSAAGEGAVSQFMTLPGAGQLTAWQPKTVWVSCDGRSAVSDGRFETAAGLVGDYMTLWVRDRMTGEYMWLQNAATLDDPQPPAKPPQPEPGPDEIVVDGLIAVKGHVADCRSRPAPLPVATAPTNEVRARDGTLVWRWGYSGSERLFELHAWTDGEWQIVMDRRWPAKAS